MAAVSRGDVVCLYERQGTLTLARFNLRALQPRP
jgi:hypothetical protein